MGNAPDRRRFPRMPVRPSAAVVLIIAVAGFLILFSALSQVSGPPGADGYYYLKQIEVLSYGGGYYYRDRSLAFLFPAALAVLTGNALTAFRLTVAVTAVLLIVAGGMVASTLATAAEIKNKTSIAVSLITTSVLTCSLTVYEFTFEYYKNAFALLLLMAAIIAAYGGTAESKRRPCIATLLVMAAFLSHKSAIFFVMSFMLLWFLRNATRRNFLVLLGSGAVSLVAFLAFFEQGRNYLLALTGFLTGAAPWTDWIGYALRKDAAFSITLCADFLIIVLYILRRRDLPVRAAQDVEHNYKEVGAECNRERRVLSQGVSDPVGPRRGPGQESREGKQIFSALLEKSKEGNEADGAAAEQDKKIPARGVSEKPEQHERHHKKYGAFVAEKRRHHEERGDEWPAFRFGRTAVGRDDRRHQQQERERVLIVFKREFVNGERAGKDGCCDKRDGNTRFVLYFRGGCKSGRNHPAGHDQEHGGDGDSKTKGGQCVSRQDG